MSELINVCAEREELGGGRVRHTQYIKPIAFRRDGVLRRMNLVYGDAKDVAMPIGVDEAMFVKFDQNTEAKSAALWEVRATDRSQYARFALIGGNAAASKQIGPNEHLFANALDGADLIMTYGGHRFGADFRLRKGHPRLISWRIDAHNGFDPKRMTIGDLTIQQPVLLSPEGIDAPSVLLKWDVTEEKGRWRLDCALPKGEWAGWLFDPTLTLQPDAAAGKDTWLDMYRVNADINTGTQPLLRSAQPYPGLIFFDCSGVPAGAVCSAATLYFYQHTKNQDADQHKVVYSIAAANTDWTELGATWNHKDKGAGKRWAGDADEDGGADAGCSVSGTDYEASLLGEWDYVAANDVGTEYEIALAKARIQQWFGGNDNNHGLLLRSAIWNQGLVCSSDHATAAYRPKLVVDYALPGGGSIFASSIFHSAITGGTLAR